ncbi:hypothetical protein RHMOL_Rhmol05G0007400 [Rhododendron molle]|uniref:Uncharacterized protein n=1 Tax=Rhododendron molle TaxID=49168 RepID=A0ACC0NJE8_RHOML|nr:hypothetical protein RHMOL_Rhmol05G0007400 [Rhododendron molle]
MLKSSALKFPGNLQLNPCNILAKLDRIILSPRLYPGHILLPDPNGNNSKLCPFTSIDLPKNLSGRNSSGASHITGSLPMLHVLMNTRVPLRMSYPDTLQSSRASCGASITATGWSLMVSLTIASI